MRAQRACLPQEQEQMCNKWRQSWSLLHIWACYIYRCCEVCPPHRVKCVPVSQCQITSVNVISIKLFQISFHFASLNWFYQFYVGRKYTNLIKFMKYKLVGIKGSYTHVMCPHKSRICKWSNAFRLFI